MQLANSARTTLVTGISAGATSITLDDASDFPAVTATILTGTVTSTVGNAYSITGTGTLFLSELANGNMVTWTGLEHRRIVMVISDTVAILDRPASVMGVALTKRDAYYLTLASGGGLTREYVLVTATSGATFTVARAQDNSTALAFIAGSTVEYRVTAGFVTQVMEQAVVLAMLNLMETHGADMVGVSASGVVAATVRLALEELAAAISAHTGDTSAAHAASAISFTPAAGIAATDVQAAFVELVADVATALSTHTSDTTAHAATAITFAPYGGLSATEVQAAIEQLWDEFYAVTSDADKTEDVITTSGQDFDPVDDFQLSKAVSIYAAGADYWSCAGSGASFTLSAPTQFNGIPETPAYSGTGNGTMTSLTGGSASIAETFTVACTVGGATGTFTVVGSTSGALASATVGTPYSTTKIAFTLNDGSTDFIIGDTFTVVMGAAQSLRKPTQYYPGMCVKFIANAANSASATVNVGGLGAKSVFVPPFNDALPANAWVSGSPVELVYNGTAFIMVKQSKAILVNDPKTTPGTSTWAWPAGVTAVEVIVIGGGGGSGGVNANARDSSATYNSVTITGFGGVDGGGGGAGGAATGGTLNFPGEDGWVTDSRGGRSGWGFSASAPTGPGVNYGYGAGAGLGGGGGVSVRRFSRVFGLGTVSYEVGAGGFSGSDGADGAVIFRYIPWTDA